MPWALALGYPPLVSLDTISPSTECCRWQQVRHKLTQLQSHPSKRNLLKGFKPLCKCALQTKGVVLTPGLGLLYTLSDSAAAHSGAGGTSLPSSSLKWSGNVAVWATCTWTPGWGTYGSSSASISSPASSSQHPTATEWALARKDRLVRMAHHASPVLSHTAERRLSAG